MSNGFDSCCYHSCFLLYYRYHHMLKPNHAISPIRCPSVMVPRRSIFPKRCNQLHAHMLIHNTLQWPLCTYVAPYHSVTRNVTVWCHHYLHNVAAGAMSVSAKAICMSHPVWYVCRSRCDICRSKCDVCRNKCDMSVTAKAICMSQPVWYVCRSRCDICHNKCDMSVTIGATYVAAGATYVTASVICLSQQRRYVCRS